MPPLMRVFTFARLPAETKLVALTPFTSGKNLSCNDLRTAFHSPDHSGPVPGAPSRLPFPHRACRLRPEKRVLSCAIFRWPSPVPAGSVARFAPARSPRLAAPGTRACPWRSCPSPAPASLFLPRQGLGVSAGWLVPGGRSVPYSAPVRSKYSADPQVSIVQQVVTVTANRSQALVEPQCFPPLRLST